MDQTDLHPVPPPEFVCPISLELMRDPVTACTGVTYDRSSINKWLERGQDCCPATMQPLHQNHSLVPNNALRSLIHQWCESHSTTSDLFRSSTSPIDRPHILLLLDRIQKDPANVDALSKLKSKARESTKNSRAIVDAGAVTVLSGVLSAPYPQDARDPPDKAWLQPIEEAIAILAYLPASYNSRRALISPKPLRSISWILCMGSPPGMMSAIAVLDGLASDKGAQIAIGSTAGVIDGLVAILRRNGNQVLVNSSLRALLGICLPLRNRARAARTGAVAALVELLPDTSGGVAEHILIVLELLCGCAEGRAAIDDHALAIPAIVKKILRVSDSATANAVGILWAVCRDSGRSSAAMRERTGGLGLFGKLLLLLRRDVSPGTRHKVIDILDKVYNARMDLSSPPPPASL
ncbi:hypothetical protein SELMODRAFT_133879 [Selaginella moellendorffii]|uniref:RING-type E3 ubiquitin transferase n=2 Tax=Selaginella moellendorffii TaxID=88036 RepID=D8T7Q5_SELML|nr:U-box domain-containing protein 31 isoform X1 [Selaginella moellendorffii]EFJ07380.1 hypothetical protein SELMODRAFT_133879 [Selaginella moellendorffii]|eukprot:XP_002991626.1 U-box domain-containing protein 31 isoform X1 [Selaginella moellendorffii]